MNIPRLDRPMSGFEYDVLKGIYEKRYTIWFLMLCEFYYDSLRKAGLIRWADPYRVTYELTTDGIKCITIYKD